MINLLINKIILSKDGHLILCPINIYTNNFCTFISSTIKKTHNGAQDCHHFMLLFLAYFFAHSHANQA